MKQTPDDIGQVAEEEAVRSGVDQTPAAYVASGTWPDVELAEDAPVSAHFGLALARRLAAAMRTARLTANAVAVRAGLAAPTVRRVLAGDVLPDLGTLARLECALGVPLYPADLYGMFPPPHPGTPA